MLRQLIAVGVFNGAFRCGKNPPVLPGEEKGAEQQKERRAKSKPKRSRKKLNLSV